LRQTVDIDACIELCVRSGAPACVSVTPVDKSPDWYYGIDADARLQKWLAPGAAPVAGALHVLNGAVYVARVEWLIRSRNFIEAGTLGYAMPLLRSVDIDSESDLQLAAALIEMRARGGATPVSS
jgi:CMP-N,N'-diacetyllegionaminic acid synthase